ncbi:MAG: ECF transporter S component [Oscillospiraceae bacterium]|nr:ECF transporter S component [Oscillospiraceae bacterium]
MNNDEFLSTRRLVLLALLTAVVVILQLLGTFIRFGPFSISLVLMPIVAGAALIGITAGFWLGLVFGLVVLVSGDANIFLSINPIGTLIVVLSKGILAGLAAAIAYKLASKINKTVGAFAAAIVCPIVNTGVFALGAYIFFYDTISRWGTAEGFLSVPAYILVGMISVNFFFELGSNVILSPVVIRIIQYGQSMMDKKKTA